MKLKSEYEVTAQEPLTLDCQAEGNPQPTYHWTPCDGGPQQSMCDNSKLNVPKVRNNSVYSFTCTVANGLGNDTTSTSVCKLKKSEMILYVMFYFCIIFTGPYKQYDVNVTTITGAKLTRKFPWGF